MRAEQQTTWARAHSILNKPYLGHTVISIVSSKEVLKFWAHIQRASFFDLDRDPQPQLFILKCNYQHFAFPGSLGPELSWRLQ